MRYLMLYKGLICNITSGPKIGGRSTINSDGKIIGSKGYGTPKDS